MAEYNVRINAKTSSGYDQLYPESKSDIIKFDKSNSNLISEDVESAIKEVDKNIGKVSTLTTDEKTNLVSAINEVDENANTANETANDNKTNIGVLSTLKTSVKTSIVNAINNLYDSIIGKTLKTIDEVDLTTEEGYYVDALAVKELNNNLKPQNFLTTSNYRDIITIGNLRGGRIQNISGIKYGKIITLYVQINDITLGGSDVTIFTFKNAEYRPLAYAVHNAYISHHDNTCYIGQFSDGHFSMAIAGSGVISSSSKVMVIFSITYICK